LARFVPFPFAFVTFFFVVLFFMRLAPRST
jgi:hypothetical protein